MKFVAFFATVFSLELLLFLRISLAVDGQIEIFSININKKEKERRGQ